MEQERKICPYCGEEIMAVAKKCRHCGEWLEPKEVQELKSSVTDTDNELNYKIALVKRVKDATGVSLADANKAVEIANRDFYKAMAYIQEKGIPKESVKKINGEEKESFFAHHVLKNCNPLFQFSGQLSRKDYWIGSIVLGIVTSSVFSVVFMLFLSGTLTNIFGRGAITAIIIMMILPLIVALGMMVRRIHDIEKNGWLVLLSFVPIANFYLLYLLCLKGQTESVKTTHTLTDYSCWVLIVLLPFIFYFITMQSNASPWISGNEKAFVDTDSVNEINEEVREDDNVESVRTPHGILSIDDAFTLKQLHGLPDKIQHFLVEHGYEYVDTYNGTIEFSNSIETFEREYWAKNCQLGRMKEGYEAMSKSANSSYIEIYNDQNSFSIHAYDESVFKAWYSQLTSKGYKLENSQGNGGQEWFDEDKSEISIWNDYGDEYVLSANE